MIVRQRLEERYPGDLGAILVFDDVTGKPVDLDYWDAAPTAPAPSVGRPRLGVKAREVTLLPRHWDWLAAQPGGASVALRRLVEDARRVSASGDRRRAAQEAAYRFMQAMAGDQPGYEDATRALFAGDVARFEERTAAWPEDVREHASLLAADAFAH